MFQSNHSMSLPLPRPFLFSQFTPNPHSTAYSSSSGAGAGAGSFAGSFGNGGTTGGVYGNTVHNGGGSTQHTSGFGANYGNKFPYPNNAAFFGTGTYNNGQQQQPAFPQQFPFQQPPFNGGAQYNQFVADFWKQFGANFQK